jgi:hypothetical protein
LTSDAVLQSNRSGTDSRGDTRRLHSLHLSTSLISSSPAISTYTLLGVHETEIRNHCAGRYARGKWLCQPDDNRAADVERCRHRSSGWCCYRCRSRGQRGRRRTNRSRSRGGSGLSLQPKSEREASGLSCDQVSPARDSYGETVEATRDRARIGPSRGQFRETEVSSESQGGVDGTDGDQRRAPRKGRVARRTRP